MGTGSLGPLSHGCPVGDLWCISQPWVTHVGDPWAKSTKLMGTDFTTAPPENQRFSLTDVSWLLDTRKDTIENKVSMYFLSCKGRSIDDVEVSRDTVFQEVRLGAGFDRFLHKKKLGGLP